MEERIEVDYILAVNTEGFTSTGELKDSKIRELGAEYLADRFPQGSEGWRVNLALTKGSVMPVTPIPGSANNAKFTLHLDRKYLT